MPGIELPAGIKLLNPSPVDTWSGPYSTVDEANHSIPLALRYKSMIVRIVTSTSSDLYWYRNGITDNDLILFGEDSTFLSTNIIQMSSHGVSNGQIIGLSTINGLAWPPIDDAFWSKSGNDIYNDNSGNIGIGLSNPNEKLEINGNISIRIPESNSNSYIRLGDTNDHYKFWVTKSNVTNTGGTSLSSIDIFSYFGNNITRCLTMGPTGSTYFADSMNINKNLTVSGSINASTFLSTNTIQMNNGIINNLSNITTNNTNLNINTTSTIRFNANHFVYNSNDPSSFNAFKVELSGSNFIAFRSSFYNGIDGTFLQNSGGGQLALGTNNPIMFINGNNLGNNNIGIGTYNPQYTLDISGNTYISSGLILNGNIPGGYGALKIQNGVNENDIFIRDGSQVNSAVNSGYFVGVSNKYGGESTFQIGRVDAGTTHSTKAIYLTQSGNVGIGTNNPINQLDVIGNVRIGSNNGNTSSFLINLGISGVGTSRSAMIYSDGNNMGISNQQNGNLILATNNSDKITILPSGNVGIQTSNPQDILQVIVSNQNAKTGISVNSADVNTTIGSYSEGTFTGLNAGSIQVTSNNYKDNYTLALNPRGGDVYIGSTTNNLIIDSGKIGIQTHNPQFTLDVSGSLRANTFLSTNIIQMTSNGASNGQINGLSTINGLDINSIVRIGSNNSNTSSFLINLGTSGVGTSRSAYIYSDGNNMQINNMQNGNLTLATNNSNTITILPSGNVGINTASPTSNLDVNGNIKCNTLIYNSLSPNVVTSLTAGNGISISGGSNTGDLTISIADSSLVEAYVIADSANLNINVIKVYSNGKIVKTSTIFALDTYYEIYQSNSFNFSNCKYIIVGGGGGGGGTGLANKQDIAGGGGGGSGQFVFIPSQSLSGIIKINISVGSGGNGGNGGVICTAGSNGNNSSIFLNFSINSTNIQSNGGYGGSPGYISSGSGSNGGNDGNNTTQFGGGNGGAGGSNTGYNGGLGNGSGGGLYGNGYNPYSANGGGGGGGGIGILSVFSYINAFSKGGKGGNASAFGSSSSGGSGSNGIYGGGGGGGGAVNSNGGNGGGGFVALYFYN